MPPLLPSSPPPTGPLLYLLPQKKIRVIIPKLFAFLFLGLIFYLAVLLNLSLLEISSSAAETAKLLSLILLGFIILLGIIINLFKAGKRYYFYQDRITFGKKQILLSEIVSLQTKQNLLDKIFQTYSLQLNQKFRIENISRKISLQDYLQKLIEYSRSRSPNYSSSYYSPRQFT